MPTTVHIYSLLKGKLEGCTSNLSLTIDFGKEDEGGKIILGRTKGTFISSAMLNTI